ncbi:MAG: ATPase, T2SS/T4P/T4SS family [Sulfurimonas sp.]|nr:ATPase, T2SS/T4P/T4SS family [Sulfurimonas sp.]
MVFSTLHTNSASKATISRLADMKVEPFLISSSLLGILAQRLVRVLCTSCKEEDVIAEEFADDYGLKTGAKIYRANGCKSCNYTGFSGRRSIGELLVMNDKVKDLLKTTTDEHTIKTELEKDGLKTISSQLSEMLLAGETSLDEAIRIGLGHA